MPWTPSSPTPSAPSRGGAVAAALKGGNRCRARGAGAAKAGGVQAPGEWEADRRNLSASRACQEVASEQRCARSIGNSVPARRRDGGGQPAWQAAAGGLAQRACHTAAGLETMAPQSTARGSWPRPLSLAPYLARAWRTRLCPRLAREAFVRSIDMSRYLSIFEQGPTCQWKCQGNGRSPLLIYITLKSWRETTVGIGAF